MQCRKQEAGLSLLEVVIAVVILGVVALIAVPKMISLSSDAQTTATNGVASALSAANATNYAERSENAANGIAVSNCTSVAGALLGGRLPAGYSIAAAEVSASKTVPCTLNGPNATSASFSATGIR